MAPKNQAAGAASTSLERLKALDSFPDLESQLEEAQQLCTHSARADMVLKWLLEKLKTSQEVRVCDSSWRLLSTAMRLLQPERLATLLASSDLLQIIQEAVTVPDDKNEVFLAVRSALNLLLELSSSERGAPLKALLSMEAPKAADFVSTWLGAISTIEALDQDLGRLAAEIPLLEPALQIWTLRKPQPDENEMFAHKCVESVATLMTSLAPPAADRPTKRKRGDVGAEKSTLYRRSLEALLARHVFLPARLAFTTRQEHRSRDGKARTNGEGPIVLAEQLSSFKTAVHTKRADAETVPMLLNVALRCIPLTTPRQRMKEKPWVEAVFAALLECITDDGKLLSERVLIAMLGVIGERASLSTQTLSKLATMHASLRESGQHKPNWQLVAAIISLDASVFADGKKADELFSAVSGADKLHESSLEAGDLVQLELRDLRLNAVVIPVVHAFARKRQTRLFFDHWKDQLLPNELGPDAVFFNLGGALAPLVESSLIESEIVDLVKEYHGIISRPEPSQVELTTSAAILDALLRGVHSPELLDMLLFEELDALNRSLIALPAEVLVKATGQVWKLMRVVSCLWFPLWAVQRKRQQIVSRASSVLGSNAMSAALDVIRSGSHARSAIDAAHLFVTAVCHAWMPYDETNRATNTLEKLRLEFQGDQTLAFVQHSGFLGSLPMKNVPSTEIVENELNPFGVDAVRALSAHALEHLQISVIEEIVGTTITDLNVTPTCSNKAQQMAGLQILESIPAHVLSAELRAAALNTMCTLLLREERDLELLKRSLAVMLRMLERPSTDSKVLRSPQVLLSIAKALDTVTGSDIPDEDLLQLFASLIQRVVFLVVHDRRETPLTHPSKALWDQLNATMEKYDSSSAIPFGLHATSIMLKMLYENAKPDIREQCADAGVLDAYTERLFKESHRLVGRVSKESTIEKERRLALLLSALAEIPRSVAGVERHSSTHDLLTLVNDISHAGRWEVALGGQPETLRSSTKSVLVKCFRVICGQDSYDKQNQRSLTTLAVRLLDLNLPPREYIQVVSAFSEASKSAVATERMEMLAALSAEKAPSDSSLALLRVLLSTLTKEDFESTESPPSRSPQAVLQRLLRIAEQSDKLDVGGRACECIQTILREKPFMTNQHNIEQTVATLERIAQRPVGEATQLAFLHVCRIFTILLQQHRSRLGDRLHLVVPLLQASLSCVFQKTSSTGTKSRALTVRHVRMLARNLQLLCNPPQMRGKQKASELVDEARKAQAHVGQYMGYVLQHYCSQVLGGTSGEGMRDALMPGIWAMIEAVEVNDQDGMKVLSSSITTGERAVLRGVYDEYKAFGKVQAG